MFGSLSVADAPSSTTEARSGEFVLASWKQLIDDGRMQPAGLAEVERARTDGRWAAAAPP